ncbi:hypothetical protein DL769_000656 [Monosporascus sp. CRB-8-3]|nr:hypothetical protein DL769_000656 [Monosporascus sp. CRB-8-3]
MRLSDALVVAATLARTISASAILSTDNTALEARTQPESRFPDRSIDQEQEELWKRKGGGGGGGRGGGSSGGGRGSGRGSSSGSSSSGGGRGSPVSNAGGRTTTGSGPRPAYGRGGAFYAGGARVPYQAGARSPGGIAPFLVVGGLGFLGGAYVAGGGYYMYPYHNQYYYRNATTDRNETKPVVCTCREYGVCSCDDNGDDEYFNSIIGDGSYEGLNRSVVEVARNETDDRTYVYINGTLPNGTTADGGTEDPNAGAGLRALVRAAGWWPVVTTALALACAL